MDLIAILAILLAVVGITAVSDSWMAEEGLTTFMGGIQIGGTGQYQIYYPTPFASPPQLAFPNIDRSVVDRSDFELVDQTADGFQIRVTSFTRSSPNAPLEWEAKGRLPE